MIINEEEKLNFEQFGADLIKPLNVSVRDYEKLTMGGSHILYEVECISYSSLVKRRYNDFLWLRNSLVKYYPGIFVPAIPSKSLLNDLFDSEFLNKRKCRLNYFFDHLSKQRILSHSEIVKVFLTENDFEEFQRKKLNYENYSPESLNYIECIDQEESGDTDFRENDEKLILTKKALDSGQMIMKKLQTEYFKLQQEFVVVAEKLKNVTEVYAELVNHHKEYSIVFENRETTLYQSMFEMHRKWEESFIQQQSFCRENFENFYGFIKKEYQAFIEMINKYHESKLLYFNYEESLTKKKERLYKQMNFEKWDLTIEDSANIEEFINEKEICIQKMLHTETVELLDLRDKYLFLNIKSIKESHKFQSYISKLLKSHFAHMGFRNKDLFSTVFSLVQLINTKVD